MRARLTRAVRSLATRKRHPPNLTIVVINSGPTDTTCIHGGRQSSGGINVTSRIRRLPTRASRTRITTLVRRLGTSTAMSNVLIRLPLPSNLSTITLLGAVSPSGSISKLRPVGVKQLLQNRPNLQDYAPCNIVHLLTARGVSLAKRGTIILKHDVLINGPVTVVLLRTGTAIAVTRTHAISISTLAHRTSVLITTINHPKVVATS